MGIKQVQPQAKGKQGLLWRGCWDADERKAMLWGEPCVGHRLVVLQAVRVYGLEVLAAAEVK